MKPTAAQRRLLERLSSGPKLRVQIEGSGHSTTPSRCIQMGWVRLGGDPHVKDQFGDPAQAYFLTDAGRAALEELSG